MLRRVLLSLAVGAGIAAASIACWVPAVDPLTLEWRCSVDQDCQTGMICAFERCAFANRVLRFTSAPGTAVAGECSAPLQIQSSDPAQNPLIVQAATRVSLVSTGPSDTQPLRFYTSSTCDPSSEVSSVEIPVSGTSTPEFYVRTTAAGGWKIRAHAINYAVDAVHALTIDPAAPAALVFLTPPQDLALQLCSDPAKVQVRDAYQNAVPAQGPTPVALSSTGGGSFQFFTDPACTAATTSSTLAAGATEATFYFMGTGAPGTVTVTATDGTRGSTQDETLASRAAAALAVITPPQTVPRDSCSGAVTLQLQDTLGKAAPALTVTSVGLGASPTSSLTFYSDSACTLVVSSVAILAHTGKATLYFRGNAIGTSTINAVSSVFAAQQDESITPPVPTQVAFVTAPQTFVAGGCSTPVIVETRGALNTAFTMTQDTVVSFSSAALSVYSNSGCTGTPRTTITIPAGSASATVWIGGTLAGPNDLQAATVGLLPALQTETVTPGAGQKVAFASGPQTLRAGTCSTAVTVQLRDAYDNATNVGTPVTVNLTTLPSGAATFHSAANCGLPAVTSITIGAGASSGLVYFTGTTMQSWTLVATPTAIGVVEGSQGQTIGPGLPTRLQFASAPQTVVAGQCSTAVALDAYDAYGNHAPASAPVTVTLAATSLTGVQFYASPDCSGAASTSASLAVGQQSLTYSFRPSAAGTGSLTATSSLTAPTPQVLSVTAGPPASLEFGTAAQTVAAGSCSGPVRLDLKDAYGNLATAAAATSIAVTTGVGSLTIYAGAGCGGGGVSSVTANAGQSSATFSFKGTLTGSGTFTVNSPPLTAPSPQSVTITGGPPFTLSFGTGAQTLGAGVCSGPVVLNARDAFNNLPAGGAAVPITLAPSFGNFNVYAGAGCTGSPTNTVNLNPGQSSVTFSFFGTTLGTGNLTVTSSLTNPAPQSVTITAGPAVAMVFTSAPITVGAGACSANIRLTSVDQYGNVSAPATAHAINVGPPGGYTVATGAPVLLFYTNPNCNGGNVTSISIAGGTTFVDFRMKSAAIGTGTLTPDPVGLTSPPPQAYTVQ